MRIHKNNDLKTILHVVAVNLNISDKIVENVFAQYYKDITKLLEEQNKEDILNYLTIKIPNFGRLYMSDIKKIKIKEDIERKKHGESKDQL